MTLVYMHFHMRLKRGWKLGAVSIVDGGCCSYFPSLSYLTRFCRSSHYFGIPVNLAKCPKEISSSGINQELKKLWKDGRLEEALQLLGLKHRQGHSLPFAYVCLLKECMGTGTLENGKRIHAHIIKNGLGQNIVVSNVLIHMYVKCASMKDAQEVFDGLPCRDLFAWTMMIGGYTKVGPSEEAFKLFSQMEHERVQPNEVTAVTILAACTTLTRLMEIHFHIIAIGVNPNTFVLNALVSMYCKCGSLKDALHVFNSTPMHDVVSWNTMIAGFSQCGCIEEAFLYYDSLRSEGFEPDGATFLGITKACTSLKALKRIHIEINHTNFRYNVFVASSLVDMYAKCGSVKDAHLVFNQIKARDVPLWNTLILGYAQEGDALNAFKLLHDMMKDGLGPDNITFLNLLKACVIAGNLDKGKEIYTHIVIQGIEKSLFMESAVINMFVKCRDVEDACHIFENMFRPELSCWNAMIGGYSMQGPTTEALTLFRRMEKEGLKPDKVTFLAVLKSCATLGSLEQAKYVHACIKEYRLDLEKFVANSLLDMYTKCGSLFRAQQVFDWMHNRDGVSWSSMIAGYAQHGEAEKAFELFQVMQEESMTIDDVTSVGILSACANAGLVEEGHKYFAFIVDRHGRPATAEQCACMVNLLGRSGRIKEALFFIKHVGVEPTSSMWMALLSACRISGHLDLANKISERIIQLEPQTTAAFVLLSNVYAASGEM